MAGGDEKREAGDGGGLNAEAERGNATSRDLDASGSVESHTSQPNGSDPNHPTTSYNEEAERGDQDQLAADVQGEELRKLQDAIENGCLDDVKELLDGRAGETRLSAKFQDDFDDGEKDQSALYLAARFGHQDVVEEILRREPNTDTRTGGFQWTALHIAAQNGHQLVVQRLLDAHADIEATTNDHETPLYLAAHNGRESVMETLLERGSNVESRDNIGWTVLHNTTHRGFPSAVKVLLEHGADIEATTNDEGQTALHIAAGWGHKEIVELLIERGAKTSRRDIEGRTPLYEAAKWGIPSIVKILLPEMDRDDIVSETKNGETALYRAAENKIEETVLILLENRAYLPASPRVGVTSMANPRECQAVGQLLVDQMKDTESTTRKSLEMVIYWAVLNGHEELVQECVKYGQDLKSWSRNGVTLLHVAASSGHEQIVSDLLLLEGMDVRAKTGIGVNAVHLAAGNGHGKVVSMLLDTLKDPDRWMCAIVEETEDKDRGTALSLAVNKDPQVAQLLWTEMENVSFEADPGAANKALVWAARLGGPKQERILGQLLRRALPEEGNLSELEKVIGTTSREWTTLHWAVYQGHEDVVFWLLVGGRHLKAKEMRTAKAIAKKMKERKIGSEGRRDGVASPDMTRKGNDTRGAGQNRNSRRNDFETQIGQAQRGGRSAYSWIFDLLHSPPPVQGLSARHDLDEEPTLQTPLPEKEKVCKNFAATIVDFYHQEGRIDFLYQSSNVFDVIYRLGPERIMSNTNIRRRENLRKEISKPRDLNPRRPRESTSETTRRAPAAGKSEVSSPGRQKTWSEVEHEAPGKSKARESRRTGGGGSEGSHLYMGELQFRWFHVAANNMDWIEDLIKRIFRDSGRKNLEHYPLSEFVNRSWSEVSGTAEQAPYMKPLCAKEPVVHKPQENKRNMERNTEQATPGQATLGQGLLKREKEGKEYPGGDKSAHPQPASKSRKNKHGKDGRAGSGISKDKHINESESSSLFNKVAIYMPYITFSSLDHFSKEDETSKDKKKQKDEDHAAESNEAAYVLNLDSELMEAYRGQVVHTSRSLDQYYYSSLLDTKFRDSDQVVTRYFRDKQGERKRMLRVDQLWLWVIDENTIITSSTHRLDDEEDPIHESILNDLAEGKNKRRSPPSSVEQMRDLIMNVTVGFISQLRVEVGTGKDASLESVLQIFENSINNISDAEARLFLELKERVDNSDKNQRGSQPTDTEQSANNPYYAIGEEIAKLREIKDIRDELNILKSLLEDQKVVWKQAFWDPVEKAYVGSKYMQSGGLAEAIDMIGDMDKYAERVQNSINSLLDLKQKQANILEAVSGRKQAEDTARQGNTIMVFTIVTIIFLPMSFLASLFALDVTSFPHRADNLVYTPGWIFPIMCKSPATLYPRSLRLTQSNIISWWKGSGKPKPKAPPSPPPEVLGGKTHDVAETESREPQRLRWRRVRKGAASQLWENGPAGADRSPKGEENV
ncbi:hypothetical protein GP486_000615 [Trichoglossum hirsutum]|uniref:Ankyrin repeat protein n=1 Tax=Trichoglossum hirsutum TaxID=265104 RepID=A0A9P8LIL8_9PEZI|nr:hypothetical protein GP486_000615 [Trichoglossum hirsutum]